MTGDWHCVQEQKAINVQLILLDKNNHPDMYMGVRLGPESETEVLDAECLVLSVLLGGKDSGLTRRPDTVIGFGNMICHLRTARQLQGVVRT